MTGLVRVAAFLAACGLITASPAVATTPDPAESTCPTGTVDDATQAWVRLAGTSAGVPSAWGTATVVVRDSKGNVIAGSFVQVNFARARCVDTRLCSAVIAGQTIDCPNDEITGFTNAAGQFTFTALGAGLNTGSKSSTGVTPPMHNPSQAELPCVEIFADRVPLCTAKVNAIDQNGVLPGHNGLTGVDGALVQGSVLACRSGVPTWCQDYGAPPCYKPLFDINRDGACSGVDSSVELGQILLGHSAGGCPGASYCP